MLTVSIPTVTFPTEVCRVERLHFKRTHGGEAGAMLCCPFEMGFLHYSMWPLPRVGLKVEWTHLCLDLCGLRESLGPHSTSPCVVCSSGQVAFPSPFLQLINHITSAIYVLHFGLFHFIFHTFPHFLQFHIILVVRVYVSKPYSPYVSQVTFRLTTYRSV